MDNIECSKKGKIFTHFAFGGARIFFLAHTSRPIRIGGGIAFALVQFRSASHVERTRRSGVNQRNSYLGVEFNSLMSVFHFVVGRFQLGRRYVCVCVCHCFFLSLSLCFHFRVICAQRIRKFFHNDCCIPFFHQRFFCLIMTLLAIRGT